MNARESTCRLLELMDEGVIPAETIVMACLKYMSEDEVADMAHINEFIWDDDDDGAECED